MPVQPASPVQSAAGAAFAARRSGRLPWRGPAACRFIALAVVALACAAAPAQAGAHIKVETQETTTSNGKPAAALLVNGAVVARLAKDVDGNPPLRRASAAATSITAAYRSGKFELRTAASSQSDRRWLLLLNGAVLLVASDQEAKAWGVEPQALAETWRSNLQGALGGVPPPPSAPSPSAGIGPPSAAPPEGTLQLGSPAAAGDAAAAAPTAGQAVYEPPTATQLESVAALPAGAIVTGQSPAPDIVNAAIQSALRLQLRLGADDAVTWRPGGSGPGDASIAPGQRRSLTLDYVGPAGNGSTSLPLQNLALAAPRESMTLFSNDPEAVYAPQLLYAADLPAGRAARLVYHHQCQAEAGLRFVVRVLSESDPGALHVVPGTAAPDVNTFYVGFKSAEAFWNNLNAGSGYIASIPSGGQTVLLSQPLPRGYTASGYMKLTNFGAQPLRIEVLALPSGGALPHGAAPASAKTTHSVFDTPYFSQDATYTAGDPWLYLRLGEARPASATDQKVLHGCYGMTHSFNVALSNPTASPALVYVLLRASAGEVKGQFFIDGEYITTPLVGPGDEALLKEIPLPPGAHRLLKVKGIALNGGFYPASVILRETRNP
jgi:hypothetical protein